MKRLVAKVATRDGRRLVGAVVSLCPHELTVVAAGHEEPLVFAAEDVIRVVITTEDAPL